MTAGITCLVLGVSGLRKSSPPIFPNRFIPAALAGFAPVVWALGWDISRATDSYPVSIAAGMLWALVVATAWIARNYPAGDDQTVPIPTHPRAWRWFAAASLVLFAFGTVSMVARFDEQTADKWLSLPIDGIALAGIYSYAFRRRLLPAHLWRVVALAYCLWAVVSLAMHWPTMMAGLHKAGGMGVFVTGLVIALPIVIGMPALTCLALLRLSWFPPHKNKPAMSG